MLVYIYKLIDPRDNQVRYIGKTTDLKIRFRSHLYPRKDEKSHKKSWILNLKRENLKPILKIIEICNEDTWVDREIYWIKYFRSVSELTNHRDGGEGGCLDEITKRKISEIQIGRKNSDESKIKLAKSLTGKKRKNSSSTYIGVCKAKNRNGWIAKTQINKKQFIFGTYEDEYIAALSYDYNVKNFPEKQNALNFPNHIFTEDEISKIKNNKIRGNENHRNKMSKMFQGRILTNNKYFGIAKRDDRWIARIRRNGICYQSKSFETPELAALEYNRMALELYGEDAKLNIV